MAKSIFCTDRVAECKMMSSLLSGNLTVTCDVMWTLVNQNPVFCAVLCMYVSIESQPHYLVIHNFHIGNIPIRVMSNLPPCSPPTVPPMMRNLILSAKAALPSFLSLVPCCAASSLVALVCRCGHSQAACQLSLGGGSRPDKSENLTVKC